MSPVPDKVERFAEYLKKADRIAVLTGAGISTESGIPDFRSADGLYRTMTSAEIFDIELFQKHPEKFYSTIAPVWRKILNAEPNAGHRALAELEKKRRKR